MTLLVAREFEAGRFEKVAILRAAASGLRVMVGRHAGTVVGYAAKAAARMMGDAAVSEVNLTLVGTRYRVTRVV